MRVIFDDKEFCCAITTRRQTLFGHSHACRLGRTLYGAAFLGGHHHGGRARNGGQRQRVGIARALILEPEIIICDETTSALDVSVQDSIAKLLAKLQREKGVSYIFICHDLALVSLISHRVAVMQNGQIVEELPGDQIVQAQHPYTKKLLSSVFSVKKRA